MCGKVLRVLWVEVASDHLTPEYAVHRQLMLAGVASGDVVVQSLSHPSHRGDSIDRVALSFDPGGGRLPAKIAAALALPGVVRAAARAAAAFQPDAIYSSQNRRDVVLASVLGRQLKVPHITHLHYTFGESLGWLARAITRRSREVFAVSEYVRQTAVLGGVREDCISTVPNTVADTGGSLGERAQVRHLLGVSNDEVLIVAVGRLDPWKGVADLVAAVATMRDRGLRTRLAVCGIPGHYVGHDVELEAMVASLDASEFVDFLGYRGDVADILHAADIFGLPSVMEPFGLVYLEAMRASLPVVALRSGGVPEVVIDGFTGLLSYPNDPEALVANLANLVTNAATRAEMGSAGRRRFEAVFDPATIGARWVELLHAAVRS